MTLPEQALAHGAMVLFIALVATSFSVGGLIARDMAPEALTFLRFLIAAAIFLAIVAARGELAVPGVASAARYGFLGMLLSVFFVTMFEGLRLTDPVSAGAVSTLIPAISALIAWPVNGQAIGTRVWIGLIVGCAGAVWVVFDADVQRLTGFNIGKGEAIFLVGCVSYAAYSPFVKRLHRGESLAELTLAAIVAAAIVTGIYGWKPILTADWIGVSPRVYLGVAYLAVFTTAITFFLIKFASLRLPSSKVMAYAYLGPAFIALYEGFLGHGWPAPPVLAGIAVTAAAVAVIETGR
jgi:drug/metabolite transporter (DMT)-like permease